MLLDLSRARTPRPGAGLGVQDRAPTGAERPTEAALGSSWLGASRPPSGGQVPLPPSCCTCGKHVASPRPSGTGIGPSGGGRGRRRYVPCAPRAAGASFAPASPALPGSSPVSPGLPRSPRGSGPAMLSAQAQRTALRLPRPGAAAPSQPDGAPEPSEVMSSRFSVPSSVVVLTGNSLRAQERGPSLLRREQMRR